MLVLSVVQPMYLIGQKWKVLKTIDVCVGKDVVKGGESGVAIVVCYIEMGSQGNCDFSQ